MIITVFNHYANNVVIKSEKLIILQKEIFWRISVFVFWHTHEYAHANRILTTKGLQISFNQLREELLHAQCSLLRHTATQEVHSYSL